MEEKKQSEAPNLHLTAIYETIVEFQNFQYKYYEKGKNRIVRRIIRNERVGLLLIEGTAVSNGLASAAAFIGGLQLKPVLWCGTMTAKNERTPSSVATCL